MSQEELDLFDFATRRMAQLRTGPAQIVWSEVTQLGPFGTSSDNVPDDVLGDAVPPRCSMSAHGPENPALADLGRDSPTIDRLFNPHGHGNSPHTVALANQVDDGPVSLPDVDVFHFQG